MCTVFGYFGTDLTEQQLLPYLERTVSRGPDAQRICRIDGIGYLVFQRLAIMGLNEAGMQPFIRDGQYAGCNGELYGFRKTKREL